MTGTYQLNPHVECVRISGTDFLIRSGHLEGYSLVVSDDGDGVAPAILEGGRGPVSVDGIVTMLDGAVERSKIEEHFVDLSAAGVLVQIECASDANASWIAFARSGVSPPAHLLRPIHIFGDRLAQELAVGLLSLGIETYTAAISDLSDLTPYIADEVPNDSVQSIVDGSLVTERASGPVLVIATGSQSIASLHALNSAAVTAGAPVLYLQASGAQVVIGPYSHPGQSACFWEFELQRSHSMFERSHYQTILAASAASSATTGEFVLQSAANAAIPWVIELGLTGRSGLLGRALIGRTTATEYRAQSILRLPRCPVCLPLRPLLRNQLI